MKACGGRGSAPNPTGELTSHSRVRPPVKHTSLHNRLDGLKCSKTHLHSKLEFQKFSRGQTPGPLLLDSPLNTMNRAANCLTPALVVVQNCCGATRLVNGTSRYLDPQGSKTPEPIDIKLDRGDYVLTSPHIQTLVFLPLRGRCCICVKLSSSVSIFYTPLVYLLALLQRQHRLTDFRGLWLKRRVFASSTSFGGCETRNSLFPQCKTSSIWF